MEEQVSVLTLIISVSTSFLGSLFFFWYLRGRENRIRMKIAELDFEEEFIDKIKKGNVELIRSGFRTVTFSLAVAFCAVTILIAKYLLIVPDFVETFLAILAMSLFGISTIICMSYFKSLVKLNDVPKSKRKIEEKRKKYENKL